MTDTTAPVPEPPPPPAVDTRKTAGNKLRHAFADNVSRVNTLSAYGTVGVSFMVVAGFFGVLFFLLVRPLGDLTDSMNAIMNILLGALVGNFISVVNYWIGSSAGSARKEAVTEAPKAVPAPATLGVHP